MLGRGLIGFVPGLAVHAQIVALAVQDPLQLLHLWVILVVPYQGRVGAVLFAAAGTAAVIDFPFSTNIPIITPSQTVHQVRITSIWNNTGDGPCFPLAGDDSFFDRVCRGGVIAGQRDHITYLIRGIRSRRRGGSIHSIFHIGAEGVHTLSKLWEPVHHVTVVGGNTTRRPFTVTDDHAVRQRVKAVHIAEIGAEFYRLLIYL